MKSNEMRNYKLALGTAQFGMPYGIANKVGQISSTEAKMILDMAGANKIDTLDTAIAYGKSEKCLGEAGVRDFKIVTKLPLIPKSITDIEAWIFDQVEASLERLKVPHLYGLLLHRSWQFRDEYLRDALNKLKGNGLVEKIGVSIYSPKELDEIPVFGALDIIQAPLNVIDRRIYSSGWLHRLHDQGVEVHTRSAFLQGLLLISRTSIPTQFFGWSDLWDTWHNWLISNGLTAAEASLGYVFSFREVDRVVVGVDTSEQLNQLIQAARVSLNVSFPDISSLDEKLINPSYWNSV